MYGNGTEAVQTPLLVAIQRAHPGTGRVQPQARPDYSDPERYQHRVGPKLRRSRELTRVRFPELTQRYAVRDRRIIGSLAMARPRFRNGPTLSLKPLGVWLYPPS